MPSTDVISARAARVGRLAWIVFGLGVLFLVVLGVTHARGSEVSRTVWALALISIVNGASGLPGLSIRTTRALVALSAAALLATIAVTISDVMR